jgi:glycosyltransferase involved in cell wall biosynthesis
MVGLSWQIKGGELAHRTLLRLLEMGIDAELTVVGCTPPPGVSHARMRVIPFLNKMIPEEWERFRRLWHESDIFILPTRFEAAGIVFCEASAYALPAIGTRTGGVPSLVRDGINGFTLPAEEWGEGAAALIANLAGDPDRYLELCESSRDEYERRLNWDGWGEGLGEIIGERLPRLSGHLVV